MAHSVWLDWWELKKVLASAGARVVFNERVQYLATHEPAAGGSHQDLRGVGSDGRRHQRSGREGQKNALLRKFPRGIIPSKYPQNPSPTRMRLARRLSAFVRDQTSRSCRVVTQRTRRPNGETTGMEAVRRLLGVEPGLSEVCDLYAAPFVHGPAVEPEIRRLQGTFDEAPELAQLKEATEQLAQLEGEMGFLHNDLVSLATVGRCGERAVATVSALVGREAEHATRRQHAIEETAAAAQHDRAAFEQTLAARRREVDAAAQRLAEQSAQRQLQRGSSWQAAS